jgi:gas vesicle protein
MREYDFDDGPYVVIEQERGSLASFMWGLALGAGLALLLAPQSGAETRRALGTGARRARVRAQETAEELSDSVMDRYERARRSVETRIDTARQAIELKGRQARRAIEAGRQAAHDARDELERRIAESKAAYQAGADAVRSRRRGAGAAGGTTGAGGEG